MPMPPLSSGPRMTIGECGWLSLPCVGRSPTGWQFRQRGCWRTRPTSTNSARERSDWFVIDANVSGPRRSSAPARDAAEPARTMMISRAFTDEGMRTPWRGRTVSARSGGCVSLWSRLLLLSRHCIGYDSQSRSRAVDVVLHRGRSAQADRPDNLSVHLDGKPATPRRYTRKRGDAGQKRRVALDKVEKVPSGDAEQSGVRLVLRNLDGRHRGPIHPAKGLEIAAVIEHRHVLANAKFSGFRHCCIHHLLCQLRRNAVFLHDVSHWTPPSLDMYCALVGRRHRNMDVTRSKTESHVQRRAPGTGGARRDWSRGRRSAAHTACSAA